jgi:hypothetical protein
VKYLAILFMCFTASASVKATEMVNVTDYISFEQAALDAKGTNMYGHVYVPKGFYMVEDIYTDAVWHLAAGAEFSPPNFSLTNLDDFSHLPGAVQRESNSGRIGQWFYGDSDLNWIYKFRKTIVPNSVLNVNANGAGAIAAYATTGESAYSQGSIGMQSYCLNSSVNKQNCYAGYFESNRAPWAGTTTTLEVTTNNYGTWSPWDRILPSGIYGPNEGISAGINISGPAGNGYYKGDYDVIKIGAGIIFTGGPSKQGMDAGIVFTRAAFKESTANEVIRTFTGSHIMWHGSGFNPEGSISTVETERGGEVWIKVWGTRGKSTFKFTEDGLILPSGRIIN